MRNRREETQERDWKEDIGQVTEVTRREDSNKRENGEPGRRGIGGRSQERKTQKRDKVKIDKSRKKKKVK